jgi:hypothetical protein
MADDTGPHGRSPSLLEGLARAPSDPEGTAFTTWRRSHEGAPAVAPSALPAETQQA